MQRKLGIWQRKLQFCSRGGLLIAVAAALGLTTLAQGGEPCTDPNAIIRVEILTDDFGNETTWELVEQGVGVIASGGPYPNATLITVDVPVCSTSCYDFTIFDSFGDGICCDFGIGFYNIFYEGNLVCSGAVFGSSETCPDIACLSGDPCTDPNATITVEILTDNFGNETTWELFEQGVGVIASGGPYPNTTLITVDVPVCSTSCYDFTIFDSFSDGICCDFGIGFYNVFYEGNLVCSGAVFGSSETCPDIACLSGDPCTDPNATITVEIMTDNFGGETTWELFEQGVGVIASGGPYPNATLITVDVPVCSTSCYDFTIFDSFGDGICCDFGIGFYNVFYNGKLVCSGAEFGSSETCPDIACESGDCPEQVQDPGFEGGTPNAVWAEASTNFGTPLCTVVACGTGTGTGPNTGDWWAWFGGIGAFEDGSVSQNVVIPVGANTLTFWLEQIVCDSPADFLEVLIDGIQVFLTDGASPLCGVLGYAQQSVDITGFADGGVHSLEFHSTIFANNGGGSNFFVDDVSIFGCPNPCPADLDLSGAVDVKDLLILLGAWGPCPPGPPPGACPADFDNSGAVDVKDLLFLLGAWGPCPGGAECKGQQCGTYTFDCNPDDDTCPCYTNPDGSGFCGEDIPCAGAIPCDGDGDCPPGFRCAILTCCGDAGICIPECDGIPSANAPKGQRTSAGR